MRLKALLEKKRELASAILAMRDKISAENRAFDAAENESWEKLNKQYNENEAAIAVENRCADVERSRDADAERARDRRPETRLGNDGANTVNDADRALAMQAWFLNQRGRELSARHQAAVQATGFNLAARELNLSLYDTDDYSAFHGDFRSGHPSTARGRMSGWRSPNAGNMTLTGAAGGYTVPPGSLVNSLELAMLTFGGVRQVAQTIRTTSGEPLTWPTANDTSNTGEMLAEETTFGTSVAATVSRAIYNAYKFSSKPVLVSYELMEDSAFNLAAVIGAMLGERLGRITNTYYTTGTGSSQPGGIVVGSTVGVTSTSATALLPDELIDLEQSVDAAYRNGAGWMMHDNFVGYARKLKDGESRYLWMPGLSNNRPDTLNGYPLTVNNDMRSSFGVSQKIILFGQLSAMKIRAVNGVRFYRLQERYRDTDQDAFIAFIREDAKVLDAGTHPIKHLLTAAS